MCLHIYNYKSNKTIDRSEHVCPSKVDNNIVLLGLACIGKIVMPPCSPVVKLKKKIKKENPLAGIEPIVGKYHVRYPLGCIVTALLFLVLFLLLLLS